MTEQTELPNPADFSVNERAREFSVNVRVTGEIRLTVDADDLDDARAKANAILEEEDFGLELDEVSDASIGYIFKTKPMYRITRGGDVMQVTRLEPGDLPREPDERGF